MKKIIFLTIFTLLILSCSTQPATPEQSVDLQATAEAMMHATQTAESNYRAVPTKLPPTADSNPPTKSPSNTLEPTATKKAPGNIYSWNYVGSQDSGGGVVVEVARVLIGDKETVGKELDIDWTMGGFTTIFDDKSVVAELIFKITNNTEKVISLYIDQGNVIVGSEQIDLLDYAFSGTNIGDDIGGEFYPGVTSIGGMWFGIKRSSLDEISSMMVAFDGPFDQAFNSLGDDFLIQIDLTSRQFVEIPEELK